MKEWISVTEAARIAGCSTTTVYSRIKADGGVGSRYRRRASGRGKARMVTREWAESLVVGGGDTSGLQAQIEGLKTRLQAAEKGRDQAITARDNFVVHIAEERDRLVAAGKERDQAIVSRDKWRAESTRQKNQIEGLKARIERMESRPAPLAGAPVGELIERLSATVAAAPLVAFTDMTAAHHESLRRIAFCWSAVDHALKQFQPGETAQTTNNDSEVT